MKVVRAGDSLYTLGAASYLDNWSDKDWDDFIRGEVHPESAAAFMPHNGQVQVALAPAGPDSQWSTIPFHEDPASCDHQQSMCRHCADSWMQDHDAHGLPADVHNQFYEG